VGREWKSESRAIWRPLFVAGKRCMEMEMVQGKATPLHMAAQEGELEAVKVLMELGAAIGALTLTHCWETPHRPARFEGFR